MRLTALRGQNTGSGSAVPQSATAPAVAQRAGGFVIRSQTNVVLVDVRVWDKSGKPISDLKPEDFRILEDGTPQKISSFSFENIEKLVQATGESGPPPTIDLSRLPANVPPAQVIRDHRLIVLFFDLTSMPVDDLIRSLKAASDFIRSRMTPADLVAVVTYTSSLRVAQNFTNDRDTLSKTLERIRIGESSSLAEAGSQGEAGGTDASGHEVVAQDVSAAFTPDETEFDIFNTDQKLGAIESLAQMLRDVPSRKSVIHFSSGVERTGVDNQAQLRATVDAANQADVSLYTLDARGLVSLPPGGDASTASPAGTGIYSGQAVFSQHSSLQSSRETLASLAADTGGRLFSDLNDFSSAFDQVQTENSSYYLIGYTPTNTRSDGRFRRIKIEVNRPGVKLIARPGYFAPKSFGQLTRQDKDLQLQQALDLDMPLVDLPFYIEASYFRGDGQKFNVMLAVKIPGSAVPFIQKSTAHQTEFDIAWRATDPAGHTVSVVRDTLPVKLTGETYEQVLKGNILYQGGAVLPPGKYQLKVVVRENQSGKIGTFEMPLSLPEAVEPKLALSSVVLSNELKEGSTPETSLGRKSKSQTAQPLRVGSQSVLPSVTRVFRSNQNLYVYLESYEAKQAKQQNAGSASPPTAILPAVGLVFFREGMKVAEAGPFPGKLPKPSEGRAIYFVQMPLQKFRPGRYWMQVNVLDPSTDQAAFARVPLAIIKPPASAAGAGR